MLCLIGLLTLLFKRFISIGILAVLTGCGFRPLYGNHTSGNARTDFLRVEVAPITDRDGQLLRNELIRRLYGSGSRRLPDYRLVTKISEAKTSLAVQKNAFATRSNLEMAASFWLQETNSGRLLFEGNSRVTVSFNILDSEFASLLGEKNARERGIRELSEDIRIRLGVFFDQFRAPDS